MGACLFSVQHESAAGVLLELCGSVAVRRRWCYPDLNCVLQVYLIAMHEVLALFGVDPMAFSRLKLLSFQEQISSEAPLHPKAAVPLGETIQPDMRADLCIRLWIAWLKLVGWFWAFCGEDFLAE